MKTRNTNSRRMMLFVMLTIMLIASFDIPRVQACWNTVLIECFSNNFNTWPWVAPSGQNPVRRWRCFPTRTPGGLDTWGIQEVVYSTRYQFYCNDDHQCAWCIGGPGTHDPDFDMYQANLSTYMTYGPVNLENATEARVTFSMIKESSFDTGDSLFWGADSVFTLAPEHVWYDTSYATETPGTWVSVTMDLKDLRRLNGDSVSAIGAGRDSVFIFWWFKANSNATRGRGAFVDDVIVQWDDGGLDLVANGIAVYHAEDTVDISNPVEVGDSLVARIQWSACDGSITTYDPYHLTVTLNGEFIIDTLITDFVADSAYSIYTPTFAVPTVGDYNLVAMVDSENEIAELTENNNSQAATFSAVPPNIPPVFTWITPSEDTLTVGQGGNNSGTLRWEAHDPDNEATISIYYDQNIDGCFGPAVPGGLNRIEADGADSLVWNLQFNPNGAIYYPFAIVYDNNYDTCVYAAFPVHIDRTVNAIDDQAIPQEFFLSQNYPNPFNPATEIYYGIHTPGHVRLNVYDLLGREVEVLVNQDMPAGNHRIIFDGRDLPSGVYIYTLSAPEGTQHKKMILMK